MSKDALLVFLSQGSFWIVTLIRWSTLQMSEHELVSPLPLALCRRLCWPVTWTRCCQRSFRLLLMWQVGMTPGRRLAETPSKPLTGNWAYSLWLPLGGGSILPGRDQVIHFPCWLHLQLGLSTPNNNPTYSKCIPVSSVDNVYRNHSLKMRYNNHFLLHE